MNRDPIKELGFKVGQDFQSRMLFNAARDSMVASLERLLATASDDTVEAALARSLQNLVSKLRSVSYEEFVATQGNLYAFLGNNPINLFDVLGLDAGSLNDQPWPPPDIGDGKEGGWGHVLKALWKWIQQHYKSEIDEITKAAEEWAKENKIVACCIVGAGATTALIAQHHFTGEISIPSIPIRISNGIKLEIKGSTECRSGGEWTVGVRFYWSFP